MDAFVIVGTRPEAIKLAPVILQMRKRADVGCTVCTTGQHKEILHEALGAFGIQSDLDLGIMTRDQSLSQIAAKVLTGLDPLLQARSPDWVVVQGDTTTVMAGALAAFHRKIAVAHVEAGLRTGDRLNPFPEEMNRVLTGQLSTLHFAPTERARTSLIGEGVPLARIHVTGNTVVDALDYIGRQPTPDDVLRQIRPHTRTVLVTAHRRENFGRPLEDICRALLRLADGHQDAHFVVPVHPNPQVQRTVRDALGSHQRVTLLPPIDYASLVHLLKHSVLVLTDSGGIQEEAPSFAVPVLVLRTKTERPEGVEQGAARLVGTREEDIVREVNALWSGQATWFAAGRPNPYGDGRAAERIVRILTSADGAALSSQGSG